MKNSPSYFIYSEVFASSCLLINSLFTCSNNLACFSRCKIELLETLVVKKKIYKKDGEIMGSKENVEKIMEFKKIYT